MDACLSCFSSKNSEDDDQEPLLSKQQRHRRVPLNVNIPPPPNESLTKIIEILKALGTGKLPSQEQINAFLRRVLQSNLLQQTPNAQTPTTPDVLRGNGPMSQQGRKIVKDLEEVIQAILQFGMEKNDDNMVQDIIFQLSFIGMDESAISLKDEAAEKMDKTKEEVNKVQEKSQDQARPDSSELSSDVRTLVDAIKSLCTTFLTSSVFRLILADAIVIGRELVGHAAADINAAALKVQKIAEGVKQQAGQIDPGISSDTQKDVNVKEKASDLVEEGKSFAQVAATEAKTSMEEHKKDWKEIGTKVGDEAKEQLVARIQEMVARAQRDPSSRRAFIAILHIIRKYSQRIASAAHQTIEFAYDTSKSPGKTSASKKESKVHKVQDSSNDLSTYPPTTKTPSSPTPMTLIPGIEIHSPHLQNALRKSKEMLERMAQGHNIDGLLESLGELVKQSVEVPQEFGRSVGKLAQEKFTDVNVPSGSGISTNTEETKHIGEADAMSSSDEGVNIGKAGDNGDNGDGNGNVFAMYFSSIGRYLDKALTEPGWATSKRGKRALETLYDATQDLLHIAGEVVADAEDIAKESVGEAKRGPMKKSQTFGKKKGKKAKGKDVQGDGSNGNRTLTSDSSQDNVQKATNQWVRVVAKLLDQAGEYVDAMEEDKTTMRLVHGLETLRTDAEELFGTGRERVGQAADRMKSKMTKSRERTGTLGLYTEWLGWAIPRLLRILPLGGIPIPRIEVKSDNIEGAIDALWIRGAALRGNVGGSINGREGIAPGASWQGEASARGSTVTSYDEGGVGGKLLPDEIVIRQWTEVRVRLAEGLGAATLGAEDAKRRMGMLREGNRRRPAGIESTSRLQIQMDGIKACARGMGYYFRYNGSLISYEDEGVLSVDLGTGEGGGRHSGFGMDLELEIESNDVEMNLNAANNFADIPLLIVEEVVDEVEEDEESDPEMPKNRDVQQAISVVGVGIGTHPFGPSKLPINIALENVKPLFKVLNVDMDLRGMKFRIDNSRHWILNNLFFQPFGGSLVSKMAKSGMENQVRKGLEAVSKGLSLILMEAKERAVNRKIRKDTMEVAGSYDNRNSGNLGPRQGEGGDGDEDSDGRMKISDVYATLLERGPQILEYYTDSKGDGDGQNVEESMHTHTEITGRGIIHASKTRTRGQVEQQPIASGSMSVPPITAYQGDSEDVDVLREENSELEMGVDRMQGRNGVGIVNANEEESHEVIVAIGTGAQLFPGKGGPYGIPKDTSAAKDGVMKDVREGMVQVKDKAGKGYDDVIGKGRGRKMMMGRYNNNEKTHRDDWRSSAFDFD